MRIRPLLFSLLNLQAYQIKSFGSNPVTSHSKMALASSSSVLFPIKTISANSISFVDADVAKAIDEKLMSQPGFSIDQLMELAGYSVACAMHDYYLTSQAVNSTRKLLIYCGPGNNGGDGLVAARHLFHFGYRPTVIYPKPSKGQLFVNLVQQCRDLNITVTSEAPALSAMNEVDGIIDAIFGFSFKGPPREPFKSIIELFTTTRAPVLSVDIPSGWDVNDGDIYETFFTPKAVISLTLPKMCMLQYDQKHYIGGRFMPPAFADHWNLLMPDYGFGPSQIGLIVPSEDSKTCTESEDKIVAMFVTASSPEEAQTIASTLVSEKLVACVNLIPGVQSVYEWQGKVEQSQEILMMIKTRKVMTQRVTRRVKELHSYEVPESIVVHVDEEGSNGDYLSWVRNNTIDQDFTTNSKL